MLISHIFLDDRVSNKPNGTLFKEEEEEEGYIAEYGLSCSVYLTLNIFTDYHTSVNSSKLF